MRAGDRGSAAHPLHSSRGVFAPPVPLPYLKRVRRRPSPFSRERPLYGLSSSLSAVAVVASASAASATAASATTSAAMSASSSRPCLEAQKQAQQLMSSDAAATKSAPEGVLTERRQWGERAAYGQAEGGGRWAVVMWRAAVV